MVHTEKKNHSLWAKKARFELFAHTRLVLLFFWGEFFGKSFATLEHQNAKLFQKKTLKKRRSTHTLQYPLTNMTFFLKPYINHLV